MALGEELHEIHEHAEHAHEAGLQPVSVTMAIVAMMLAAVTVLGHRAHTEEILLQGKITDGWGYFQSKNVRRHIAELFTNLMGVVNTQDAAAAAKLKEDYSQAAERYKEEGKEIEAENHKLEDEVHLAQHQADRFDLSEGVMEMALVIISITLLTKKRIYWLAGIAIAALGAVTAGSAFLLH